MQFNALTFLIHCPDIFSTLSMGNDLLDFSTIPKYAVIKLTAKSFLSINRTQPDSGGK